MLHHSYLTNKDTRKIGPLHIMSASSGEVFNVILEQIDYGLLCLNHCAGPEPAGPPQVTNQPATDTYVSVCQKLGALQCTAYPKTKQTISFVPSNDKVPVTIQIQPGPPCPSPPRPQHTTTAPTQHSLNSINYHSWK